MKLGVAKSVNLIGDYMNHSIQATVISTLDSAGFEGRHIIQLSSHKSESTIKEYSTKCPENKRKEMFESLSDAMNPPMKKAKKIPSATVSKGININDVKEDLPNFQLEELSEFDMIDDTVLADLMLDFPEEQNKNANQEENVDPNIRPQVTRQIIARPNVPNQLQQNNFHEINTQYNTFNQPRFPQIPQMYFPSSNVMINYNFKQ